MNEAAVCAALGITLLELYQLQRNPSFPQPTDGLWNSGAITTFAATMASALANWPTLQPSAYATANWSELASASPGNYASSPGGLFGGANESGIYGSGGPRTGIYGKGGLFD